VARHYDICALFDRRSDGGSEDSDEMVEQWRDAWDDELDLGSDASTSEEDSTGGDADDIWSSSSDSACSSDSESSPSPVFIRDLTLVAPTTNLSNLNRGFIPASTVNSSSSDSDSDTDERGDEDRELELTPLDSEVDLALKLDKAQRLRGLIANMSPRTWYSCVLLFLAFSANLAISDRLL
jgi:hypothetical protein